jgi:hypothetical protein
LIFHDQTAAFRICTKPHKAALLQTSRKAASSWGAAPMVLAVRMWLPPWREGIDGPTRRVLLRPLYTLRFWV